MRDTKNVKVNINKVFNEHYKESGLTNLAFQSISDILDYKFLNNKKKLRFFIKKNLKPYEKAGFNITRKVLIKKLLKVC